MTPADDLRRVLEEALCIRDEPRWRLCTVNGYVHPDCALAALQAHFASDEVRERMHDLVGPWRLAKHDCLAILAALGLTPKEARHG